jgi:hypothetical protein
MSPYPIWRLWPKPQQQQTKRSPPRKAHQPINQSSPHAPFPLFFSQKKKQRLRLLIIIIIIDCIPFFSLTEEEAEEALDCACLFIITH